MLPCFNVTHPGVLSLIQDNGRFGYAHLGITSGGVADSNAYYWLNRLLQNHPNAACIEVTIGGLKLVSHAEQMICVTGADVPLTINAKLMRNWCCHRVAKGDVIELGYAKSGLRAYLGVHQGFKITPQFGSCSTVVREGLGGFSGQSLQGDERLNCQSLTDDVMDTALPHVISLGLGEKDIPRYSKNIEVRVVLGYQYQQFSNVEKDLFFKSEYQVSKQCDRMGYRLQGAIIHVKMPPLTSEGICYGAIQIPPDGQPIILLNDRQTLGGYPKLGSILSLDGYKLMQCGQGAKVRFIEITPEQAKSAIFAEQAKNKKIQLKAMQSISA